MDIAKTAEFERLRISGSGGDAYLAWEEIMKRNGEQNGSFRYSEYLENHKSYAELNNEYILTKALLIKLCFVVDFECIQSLRELGYKINTENSAKYEESLTRALRKSENLITKINMRKNQIESVANEKGDDFGFEEVMASLISSLGFEVSSDITLARYNEYKKIIKKKHERNKKG